MNFSLFLLLSKHFFGSIKKILSNLLLGKTKGELAENIFRIFLKIEENEEKLRIIHATHSFNQLLIKWKSCSFTPIHNRNVTKYRAESKTGQSYYEPKVRKQHDSYGFLHYGKNCNDITNLLKKTVRIVWFP
jgi:hypothetical protein